MPLTEQELKRELKSGVLRRVYFLYGEESYLTAHYAERLAVTAVPDRSLVDFNVQRLDGGACTAADIAEAAEALPLMAPQKCVLVKDFDAAASAAAYDGLAALIEQPPESCVLVLYTVSLTVDARKSARWKSLIAAVDKAGASVALPLRTEAEAVRLLCQGAARRGCTLEANTARGLRERCGTSLRVLLGELDKLCALADGGTITPQHVDALCVPDLSASIYDLSKALLRRDAAGAYGIVHRLLSRREKPVVLLSELAAAYADLYRARVALSAGEQPTALAANFNYRGRDFRLRNAGRDARRLSVAALRDSLEVLAEADRRLKGSSLDERLILDQTVARLLLAAEVAS